MEIYLLFSGNMETKSKVLCPRQVLKTADERMYQDKEIYYQDHPEIKR